MWFTLTFKNEVSIIKKATELHDNMVNELKIVLPVGNFSTQCLFQPMPTLFMEHSVRRGGNVLGLDQAKENTLLWLLVGSTETTEESAIMRVKMTTVKDALEEFARSENLIVDWQYLNYADETQNPLKSYSQRNVDFIRGVADKYDPDGMIQKKVVSGWKLSRIDA